MPSILNSADFSALLFIPEDRGCIDVKYFDAHSEQKLAASLSIRGSLRLSVGYTIDYNLGFIRRFGLISPAVDFSLDLKKRQLSFG